MNSDHENHRFQEIDDENEIDEIEFFPSYAKPNVNRQELQKNENIRSRTRKESYRTLDEKPTRAQVTIENNCNTIHLHKISFLEST